QRRFGRVARGEQLDFARFAPVRERNCLPPAALEQRRRGPHNDHGKSDDDGREIAAVDYEVGESDQQERQGRGIAHSD
ncbi:MAG TPA: hypothetical protein VN742_06665, partial [Candidatus Binataceae bacterium]|nr:hypothetical protein [Candidatus Binataceae bacterium]